MVWWENILEFIQKTRNQGELPLEYIVDAFPVSACRNIRIRNCRIYQGGASEDIILVNVNGFTVSKLL